MEIDSGPTPGPGQTGEQPRDVARLEGQLAGDRLLVPLFLSEIPAVIDQLRVAETLVRATDASLHLLVPIARGYLETAQQRIARPEKTTTRLLEADDVADAIVEQSAYYELTVIGAPTTGRLRRLIFGSTNRSIRGSARSVVLSARANQ